MSDLSHSCVLFFRIAAPRSWFLPLLHLSITGISVLHIVLTLRPACNGSLTNHILYFFLHISSRLITYSLPYEFNDLLAQKASTGCQCGVSDNFYQHPASAFETLMSAFGPPPLPPGWTEHVGNVLNEIQN